VKNHKKPVSEAAALIAALLLTSCLGSRQFHFVNPGNMDVRANYIELHSEVSAATLHFPAGLYTLYAIDKRGYYYRAPKKIIQHTAAGLVLREGGMYVRKNDPRRMRGYVFIAGALTHVGRFSAQERPAR
jgi:hypothetical protein